MVGSKWMKAKLAFGLKFNSCLYVPKSTDELAVEPPSVSSTVLSPRPPRVSDVQVQMPGTPTPSSSGLQLPKHSYSKSSSKKICAICLGTMKPGCGHAIFTAECSHAFHFHCIASNVKHGKQTCPVCRAKWKEIPFKSTDSSTLNGNSRTSVRQEDALIRAARRLPSSRANVNAEPDVYDDDDALTMEQANTSQNNFSLENIENDNFTGMLEVKTFPEVAAVAKSKSFDKFSILVHLKAPIASVKQEMRAAVDLVTVLDVSGSMSGSKLALVKRAMGFVIQNLGPADRLSVIAFSSNARRLFSLRRMNDTGKNEALQAVNSLTSNGGTNISEGLRKAAKVMTDRKTKNAVCSIILLSDGQDTYTMTTNPKSAKKSLLPVSMHRDSTSCLHIPVHTFGFGSDHDSVSMHLISETSGGTFSFIEAESTIQDAFAQCIGGLLSVVVQGLKVEIDCIDPVQRFVSIKSGSYKTLMASDKKQAVIEVGDLYAEEERDFLITIDIPVTQSINEMSLLKVRCAYNHPTSKSLVTLNSDEVKIQRPIETGHMSVSKEVEKQRNRLESAEGMAEAKAVAEEGDLASAVSILEKCRKNLSESTLAREGDRMCIALDAELREMQERMANRQVYEASGRAYVLSGLSSHSWQRATARGDSTDSTSLVQSYQTPSMVDMVNLSQTMVFGRPSERPSLRSTRSFPARPQPR